MDNQDFFKVGRRLLCSVKTFRASEIDISALKKESLVQNRGVEGVGGSAGAPFKSVYHHPNN